MSGPVVEVDHPLVQHKLGLLRDETTTTQMFRQLVNELTLLLTYEATKDLATETVEVTTPNERASVVRISGKKVAICPILRAGVGMLDGVLSLISGARVGFIGLYRDEETLQPVEYYVKLPQDIAARDVIILDPMLATGNSTAAAVALVKGAGAQSVRLIARDITRELDLDLLLVDRASPTTTDARAESPICFVTQGLIRESLLWATGQNHDVDEISCKACGANACEFKIVSAK